MNILSSWKWIVGGLIGIGVVVWVYGEKRYEAGKTFVYQQIADSPVKIDTVWKDGSAPPPKPIIKWLKPDAIYEVPNEVQKQIDSMGNDIEQYKKLLADKAKPYSTKLDSSFSITPFREDTTRKMIIPFSLTILSYPWNKMNRQTLQLGNIDYQYPATTQMRSIVKEPPWWQHVLEIGGGILVGYEVSKIK